MSTFGIIPYARSMLPPIRVLHDAMSETKDKKIINQSTETDLGNLDLLAACPYHFYFSVFTFIIFENYEFPAEQTIIGTFYSYHFASKCSYSGN
jgi:hypothetical protein